MNRGISTIRPAEASDLALLSEFWVDRMTLLMQMNRQIRLTPDARARREAAMRDWMQDEKTIFLVGLAGEDVVGAIAGRVEPNTPGLLPQQVACVLDLVIDMHTTHTAQGIGRTLLNAFRERVGSTGVNHVVIQVTAGLAVEQAFWRGMGAKTYAELFWMDV